MLFMFYLLFQITKGYDCSDMDLQSIPDEIPNSVQILQFSFNYLPVLYNSTFQRLKSLQSLDLTRWAELNNKLSGVQLCVNNSRNKIKIT